MVIETGIIIQSMQEEVHSLKFPLVDQATPFGTPPRPVSSGNYWSADRISDDDVRIYYLSFPVVGYPRVSYRSGNGWHLSIYPKLYV